MSRDHSEWVAYCLSRVVNAWEAICAGVGVGNAADADGAVPVAGVGETGAAVVPVGDSPEECESHPQSSVVSSSVAVGPITNLISKVLTSTTDE